MKNMKNKKVALFGDSIMFGSGNCGFGVGEYLEKDLGVKILANLLQQLSLPHIGSSSPQST